MKKQIVSTLLALCMLLCLMPTAAFAEESTETPPVCSCETACTAEQLTPENWQEFLIAPDRVFDFPALDFDDEQARKLRNGLGVEYSRDGEYKLYLDDEFYGIACAEGGILRAKVKLV